MYCLYIRREFLESGSLGSFADDLANNEFDVMDSLGLIMEQLAVQSGVKMGYIMTCTIVCK